MFLSKFEAKFGRVELAYFLEFNGGKKIYIPKKPKEAPGISMPVAEWLAGMYGGDYLYLPKAKTVLDKERFALIRKLVAEGKSRLDIALLCLLTADEVEEFYEN